MKDDLFSELNFIIDANLGCLFGTLFAFVAIGPLILVYQTILWLRDGYWTAIATHQGLAAIGIAVPSSSWVGLNKIFLYVASTPLWVTVLFASLAFELLVLGVADFVSKKAAEKRIAGVPGGKPRS